MFPNQPAPSGSLSDKHVIETPEQMPLAFAIAGIGSRFLALAVDTLIQAGVVIVLFIVISVLGFYSEAVGLRQHYIWVIASSVGIFFLIIFGYFAVFEILWNGQTPGKRVVGIR